MTGRTIARGLTPPPEEELWARLVVVVTGARAVRFGFALGVEVEEARRMWTCGPGKRTVPAPMRTKEPVLEGGLASGAAMERRAVVVLVVEGR